MMSMSHRPCRCAYLTPTVLLALVLFSGLSFGREVAVELDVNSDDIAGRIGLMLPVNDTTLVTGVGVINNEDSFKLVKVDLGLRDSFFTPPLTLGLGFEGVWGDAPAAGTDHDIGAIGFSVFGEYDFRKRDSKLPIGLSASITLAPDPLAFDETDSYVDYSIGVTLYLVNQSGVVVRYRRLEADFDTPTGTVTRSDNSLLFGFHLIF